MVGDSADQQWERVAADRKRPLVAVWKRMAADWQANEDSTG